MAGPWDNVSLPGGPSPASYAGRLVDLSGIGDLPNQYYKGQEQQSQLAMRNAFKEGLPKDAQGNVDIKAITDTMAKLGGGQAAMQMIPMLQMQQMLAQPSPEAGGEQPATPQRAPIPPHGIPTTEGGDKQGSVMDMVGSAGVPETEAGKVATTIARRLGVDPNEPLTDPAHQANVQRQLQAYRTSRPQSTQSRGSPGNEQTPPPAEDAGASTLPPNYNEAEAKRLDEVSRRYYEASRRQELMKTGSGASYQKRAEDLAKQAADIRKNIVERGPGSVQLKAQEALQTEKIKRSMKTYEGINAQASQYEADMRPYVTLSKSLLNDPTMYSGIGGQWSLDFNRVKAALGDQKAAQLQEALQKVTANTVLGQINQQRNEMMEAGSSSGRLFAQQVSQVEKAAPQLATTLGGNRFLVEVQQRIGDLASKRAEMARDYLQSHPILDEGFDAKLSKWMRANPLFTAAELANPNLVGTPQVPDAIAAKGPQAVMQWAASMHSDVIRTHDGRYVHPPGQKPAQPGLAVAQPQQQM